ncbi:MAG: iron-sulfur cluster assembly scaffold protein [Chloroflexi bacterium]|nr:iron-sulfur cluster assembly scaffold protein [Chloroflexota bacterium]
MFSETLLDHFQAPRNVGEMRDADAEAEEANPVCGDRLHLWLRIDRGIIEEATWRAEGCAPAIAAASVTSELLRGMSVEQARALDRQSIADALGGLPARKAHAAILAVSAVRKALANFDPHE